MASGQRKYAHQPGPQAFIFSDLPLAQVGGLLACRLANGRKMSEGFAELLPTASMEAQGPRPKAWIALHHSSGVLADASGQSLAVAESLRLMRSGHALPVDISIGRIDDHHVFEGCSFCTDHAENLQTNQTGSCGLEKHITRECTWSLTLALSPNHNMSSRSVAWQARAALAQI